MNKFRVGDKVRVKNNINSKNWIGICKKYDIGCE